MTYHYNLRELFLDDPFQHSGIYDGLEYCSSSEGIKKQGSKRGIASYCITGERELQAALLGLLLVGESEPKTITTGGLAAQLAKGGVGLVISPKSIETHYHAPVVRYDHDHPWRFSYPSKLNTLFRTLIEYKVWLNDDLDPGVCILVPLDPMHVGVITRPEVFPYPCGAGVYRDRKVKVYRLRDETL